MGISREYKVQLRRVSCTVSSCDPWNCVMGRVSARDLAVWGVLGVSLWVFRGGGQSNLMRYAVGGEVSFQFVVGLICRSSQLHASKG